MNTLPPEIHSKDGYTVQLYHTQGITYWFLIPSCDPYPVPDNCLEQGSKPTFTLARREALTVLHSYCGELPMSDLKQEFIQSYPNTSPRLAEEIFDAAGAAAARPFPIMTDTQDLKVLSFVASVLTGTDQMVLMQPTRDARYLEVMVQEVGIAHARMRLDVDQIDQLIQILSRARAVITKS